MKFLYFGLLFLAAKNVFAQDDLSSVMNGLSGYSEECTKELEGYEGCLDLENLSIVENLDKPESIKKFCSEFESDKCSKYVKDITKTDSVCLKKDNENFMDMMAGLINYSLKVTYLAYCAKGSDGKLCPYSQYITDNIKTIDSNKSDTTEMTEEEKKILNETCKNTKCIENLESINNIVKALNEMSNANDNVNTSIDTNKFNLYSDFKCENVNSSDNSSSATTLLKFTFSCVALMIASAFMLL
ncbi:hypothetical protein BCR36DRAFT_583859 [Piromyces finnis]|uniref:Uncharacterized protein n=1 Tax=Piromyces finnis TaxID=1754191 RepID=A0A1Y1V7I9_9FUNG|nr:hypothetical protein BCR36DRAFT_583859 [Piromyces finnis]|eukprot:ORX49256.1 hypothetical protein BCR36DRAFT_583859 [Piromyces finnis]